MILVGLYGILKLINQNVSITSYLWYYSEVVESRERKLLKVSRASDLWYYSEIVESRERRKKEKVTPRDPLHDLKIAQSTYHFLLLSGYTFVCIWNLRSDF